MRTILLTERVRSLVRLTPADVAFLLDRHPDVMRIVASDLTYVADNRAEGADLILQTADGEQVRVRNMDPETRVVMPDAA